LSGSFVNNSLVVKLHLLGATLRSTFFSSVIFALNTRLIYHIIIQPGEDWRCVRCICGAILGRCQEHQSGDGVQATVYRLVKYAIRPITTALQLVVLVGSVPLILTKFALFRPLRIPLSAFIVEDMDEFVQAHATYRFVIFDEEEERPRMLVCPSILQFRRSS